MFIYLQGYYFKNMIKLIEGTFSWHIKLVNNPNLQKFGRTITVIAQPWFTLLSLVYNNTNVYRTNARTNG